MSGQHREISKPLAMRLLELLGALQLIRDSLAACREGRQYHLVSLAGQLRALLTERARRADPLLLEIARVFGRPLAVYCMPSPGDRKLPEQIPDKPLLHVAGFPITAQRQFAAQLQLQFADLLDRRIITFKDRSYTPKDLIEWYANWAGGAHYSRNLPEDFAELLSVNSLGFQPSTNVLIQIGEATLSAGCELLKSLVDFEIHAIVVVPPQATGTTNYLFDMQYQHTPMRISIGLNERLMPCFLVAGLQGSVARLDADRLVDWTAPRHLQASLRIEDDLATVLEFVIDGERIGRLRVPVPLLVLSDPLNYDFFHNKAADGKPQDFSFGLGEFIMYAQEMRPIDQANMQLYFGDQLQNPELPVVLYGRHSYGHAPPGTKNLAMTGSVEESTVRAILAN